MKTTTCLLAASCVALVACVSQGKYDKAVATTETTRAELQKKNAELQKTHAELQQRAALLEQTSTELAQQRAEAARLLEEIEQLEELDNARAGEHAATRSRIGVLQKRLAELEAAQRAS